MLGMLLGMMLIASCGHKHTWKNATCTSPKICSECGETEGEALGHSIEVGICDQCGEIQGSEVFQKIVDKVADAEIDYNVSFNAIVYSGATEVSQFKKAVDSHSAGFNSYIKKINEAIELCGDYEILSSYKEKLEDATKGLPTSMNGTNDKSFDDYMDGLEDHALKLYAYQMAEVPLYEKFGVKARTITY